MAARAARWPTPKRCCSSVITRPRRWKSTPWLSRAWVPTRRWVSPAARRARQARFWGAVMDPVSRSTTRPEPSSRPFKVLACWWASSSVGAMRAVWQPFSQASQAQAAATTVLPEPTSPWSRRFMGVGCFRSAPASSMARRWAPVRGKGSRAAKAPRSCFGKGAARCPCRRPRMRVRPRVRQKSSSNISRRRARVRAGQSGGKWMS